MTRANRAMIGKYNRTGSLCQEELGRLSPHCKARQAYRRTAQADGDPVKLEGQARLRALDAYALRMQDWAR